MQGVYWQNLELGAEQETRRLIMLCERCKEKEATQKAHNRATGITFEVCEKCAEIVADVENPEYVVNCPNCNCKFGVN